VEAEPAGEEPVAVGDVEDVVGAPAGARERARVDVGESLDVPGGVRHDGGLAAGPRRGVHADGLLERHGERPERIGVAELPLHGERKVLDGGVERDPGELLTPVGRRRAQEAPEQLAQPPPLERSPLAGVLGL
jgi:hypothetical protein